MNSVAIAGSPKRSSWRSSWWISALASTRGATRGVEALSHPTTPSVPSAKTGSSLISFAVHSMVRGLLDGGRLELRPARGAPDAQLLAAEQRARQLDHDREHVG